MEPERNHNGSRTDPERIPNGPRTNPERIPNGPGTDPERTPNGSRTDPERTPNGPRTDPAWTPNGPRTDLARTPNGPRTTANGDFQEPKFQKLRLFCGRKNRFGPKKQKLDCLLLTYIRRRITVSCGNTFPKGMFGTRLIGGVFLGCLACVQAAFGNFGVCWAFLALLTRN